MTDAVATVRDADARWLDWYTRGAESDRRNAVRMGTLAVLLIISVVAWLLISLF